MRKEIQRAFGSPLFLLSVLMFFLTLQGYAIPAHLHGVAYEPLKYRPDALSLSLGGIFFGGVILLMPFCAPMAHSVSQVDDLRSGILQWSVLRSSVRKYVIRKSLSTFLTSAAALGGAFAIHALMWNLLALPYDPVNYPAHEIAFWEHSLFLEWSAIHHALPIYIHITFGIALSAGVWGVTALASAVWIPDKLLAVTIPACIYKLWGGNLAYFLFDVWLESPDTLFNDAQTTQTIMRGLTSYGILLALSLAVYYYGVKRRACNA